MVPRSRIKIRIRNGKDFRTLNTRTPEHLNAHTPHTPSLLLVNYEYPPIGGGAGTATWQIGRHLAAAGCRVAVLTSRFRGQPAFVEQEGIEIHRVPVLRRRADRCTPLE